MDSVGDVEAGERLVDRLVDRLVGLESCISPELIEQVVRESRRESRRKCGLNASFTVWLVLAMGLLTDVPIRGCLVGVDASGREREFRRGRRCARRDSCWGSSRCCCCFGRLREGPKWDRRARDQVPAG
jgi:Insertion element 4 transposase N-terminal